MNAFTRDFIANLRAGGRNFNDESKTDADCLQQFDVLPDLLAIAKERDSGNRYRVQDKLREQYRANKIAFLYSISVRSHGICRKCDEKFTQVIYQLENPRQGTSASTSSTQIHAVRNHGGRFNRGMKQFLSALND